MQLASGEYFLKPKEKEALARKQKLEEVRSWLAAMSPHADLALLFPPSKTPHPTRSAPRGKKHSSPLPNKQVLPSSSERSGPRMQKARERRRRGSGRSCTGWEVCRNAVARRGPFVFYVVFLHYISATCTNRAACATLPVSPVYDSLQEHDIPKGLPSCLAVGTLNIR
jgi:hypothetical protein